MTISIEIDDNVKKWIKKKGNTLTISSRVSPGCCGGSEELDISYKRPKKETNYTLIEQEDCFIYIQKGIPLKTDELHLSMMGKSIFSSVYVDGLGLE
jgi:hypothetical protein